MDSVPLHNSSTADEDFSFAVEGDFSFANYLRDSPKKFNYRLDATAQKEILRVFLSSLCGFNYDYINLLFPEVLDRQDELKPENSLDPEYLPAQKGKPCGHVFKRGEGVYRCRNCALDDTCVLCSRCFHATDHTGHDTSFSVNSGSGGCCDCGDLEAWKIPLQCSYHTADEIQEEKVAEEDDEEDVQPVPDDLVFSIQETMLTVIDFMLQTLCFSPESLTYSRDIEHIKQETAKIDQIIGSVEPEQTIYACVLWNDESHSFQEVIDQVIEATGCSKVEANRVAHHVDSHGRETVEISSSIPRLQRVADRISSIGLSVTIRSARDNFREEISGMFIQWLKELSVGKRGQIGSVMKGKILHVFMETLCEVLGQEPSVYFYDQYDVGDSQSEGGSDTGSNICMDEDEESYDPIGANEDRVSMDYNTYPSVTTMVVDDEQPNNRDESQLPNLSRSKGQTSKTDELSSEFTDGSRSNRLRLDKLLIYDLRLWREARNSLRELYITASVAIPWFKKFIAVRFALMYHELSSAFLLRDQVPEDSIILFSVQVFTVPTISEYLVQDCHFLTSILSIFRSFFLTGKVKLTPFEVPIYLTIDCDSEAMRNRRYFHIFSDLRYLVSSDNVKRVIPKEPAYLGQYMDFLVPFQGMNPSVRYVSQHIEYETDTWINAFNATLHHAKLCRNFAECYTTNTDVLARAIREVILKISEWANHSPPQPPDADDDTGPQRRVEHQPPKFKLANNYNIVEYEISSQPVSFHHPLHWFFGGLLENVHLLETSAIIESGYRSFKNMLLNIDEAEGTDRFLALVDYPIRVSGLLAQIRAGLWVRNGFGIRNQAHHYLDCSLRENTYDLEVLLIQTALVVLDTDRVLTNIVDRYGLLNWFNNIPNSEFEPTQLMFLIEDLLNLIIICVGERAIVTGITMDEKVRREIIHGCISPIAYSELTKRIPERLIQYENFDEILKEVSNFKPPDGISHGCYELKEEYYDAVDPYFIHYSRNNREEAEEILKTKMQKQFLDKDTPVFVKPKLVPIERGPYINLSQTLHSPSLCRIIFNALWYAVHESLIKSETIVDEALHLIMMAFEGLEHEDGSATYSSGFIFNAMTEKYLIQDRSISITLLEFLLEYFDHSKYPEVKPKTDYIISVFDKYGGPISRESIAKVKHEVGLMSESVSAELTEHERKKIAAKELQTKIMNDFAKAQQSFLAQNEDYFSDMEEDEYMDDDEYGEDEAFELDDSIHDDIPKLWEHPVGTCIVCQEELDRNSLYGMLGSIQDSRLLRHTFLDDPRMLTQVLDAPETLDDHVQRNVINDDVSHFAEAFSFKSSRRGLYGSSCGHLMHVQCFNSYFASIEQRHSLQPTRNHPENIELKEFMCPLCKSLGNILIPVVTETKEHYEKVIQYLNPDYSKWINEEFMNAAKSLIKESEINEDAENSVNISDGAVRDSDRLSTSSRFPDGRRESGAGRLREAITQFVQEFLRAPGAPLEAQATSTSRESESQDGETVLKQMFVSMVAVMHSAYFHQNIEEPQTSHHQAPEDFNLLSDILAYTISCLEIKARGVKKNDTSVNGALLGNIGTTTWTLLRVFLNSLTRFATAYPENDTSSETLPQWKKGASRRMKQIIYHFEHVASSRASSKFPKTSRTIQPLLGEDPFFVLVELCGFAVSSLTLDVYHLLRLLYTAEVVRVIVALGESALAENQIGNGWKEQSQYFRNGTNYGEFDVAPFAAEVLSQTGKTEQEISCILSQIDNRILTKMIRTFTLPFLRRAAIFFHVRFGLLMPPANANPSDSATEFDRLCEYLRLPALSEICISSPIIYGWCYHLQYHRSSSKSITPVTPIHLNHPCIFELIPLPGRLDALFQVSSSTICRRCGKVPSNPALCLLCGIFLCSQSDCCIDGKRGECYRHMKECLGSVGMCLLVKKSMVVYQHRENGCFMDAPYLDVHGEVDHGLRRGRPQYLNLQRYDDVRRTWLTQTIPIIVARKIEQTFDTGGWDTL
ncbi:E3 ubiquitin-protein ligase ubr1 [Basidiobolus ranarum]|uniref:E3 ubiquitin-protein ligase n=1 Tax=Basidiobolus ranarum TaxID=34480 RepID=A0ABR2X0M6_9FUNG